MPIRRGEESIRSTSEECWLGGAKYYARGKGEPISSPMGGGRYRNDPTWRVVTTTGGQKNKKKRSPTLQLGKKFTQITITMRCLKKSQRKRRI